ncbi:hypothetical protein QBC44DRAFT_332943 [Cladorrhinum sp. PSN332]|nr:hypothetical protein QBC44DRAFT_332943 [Cladorrhinum sp. PSN332]
MEQLNGSFETTFQLASEEFLLGRDKRPALDRSNITSQDFSDATFVAKVSRVQYGTCDGKRACLVMFDFFFNWQAHSNRRFRSARISFLFKPAGLKQDGRSSDDSDSEVDDEERPHIIFLMPWQVYGKPKTGQHQEGWKWGIGLSASTPIGLSPSANGEFSSADEWPKDTRMSVQGYKKSSDDSDVEDMAVWTITANPKDLDAFPPCVQAAVVLRWPTAGDCSGIKAEPKVVLGFESFWTKWYQCLLRQRRIYPISFDGKISKGQAIGKGKDFGDASFDWSGSIDLPTEYQNALIRR